MSTHHLILALFVVAQQGPEACANGGAMMIQLCGGKTTELPLKLPPANRSNGAKACHAVCCRKRELEDREA